MKGHNWVIRENEGYGLNDEY